MPSPSSSSALAVSPLGPAVGSFFPPLSSPGTATFGSAAFFHGAPVPVPLTTRTPFPFGPASETAEPVDAELDLREVSRDRSRSALAALWSAAV